MLMGFTHARRKVKRRRVLSDDQDDSGGFMPEDDKGGGGGFLPDDDPEDEYADLHPPSIAYRSNRSPKRVSVNFQLLFIAIGLDCGTIDSRQPAPGIQVVGCCEPKRRQ